MNPVEATPILFLQDPFQYYHLTYVYVPPVVSSLPALMKVLFSLYIPRMCIWTLWWSSRGGVVYFCVYHRYEFYRWMKRQPRIKLLCNFLWSLYRTYERTSAWRFAGCWLKKVSLLLGSLCVCLHLWVVLNGLTDSEWMILALSSIYISSGRT
jgi:hypothetical protein